MKWAGGKRQLLPEIEKYIPENYGTYYEPFVGAGALFLHIQPEHAVINDFNSQLIMTYQVIKDDVDSLIPLLADHKKNNGKEYFYKIREQDREASFKTTIPTIKAARMIYLNKTCFNGLYRVNSSGYYNVPYAGNKNPAILEEELLRNLSKYLNENKVDIYNKDFESVMKLAKSGDFVYLDPPYHSENNTNFTGYQAGGFDENEQLRLRDAFKTLQDKGVMALLSNADTEFIREIYKDFTIETVLARRSINSNGKKRGVVNEVLIRNY